jgi:hypothetical protein
MKEVKTYGFDIQLLNSRGCASYGMPQQQLAGWQQLQQ